MLQKAVNKQLWLTFEKSLISKLFYFMKSTQGRKVIQARPKENPTHFKFEYSKLQSHLYSLPPPRHLKQKLQQSGMRVKIQKDTWIINHPKLTISSSIKQIMAEWVGGIMDKFIESDCLIYQMYQSANGNGNRGRPFMWNSQEDGILVNLKLLRKQLDEKELKKAGWKIIEQVPILLQHSYIFKHSSKNAWLLSFLLYDDREQFNIFNRMIKVGEDFPSIFKVQEYSQQQKQAIQQQYKNSQEKASPKMEFIFDLKCQTSFTEITTLKKQSNQSDQCQIKPINWNISKHIPKKNCRKSIFCDPQNSESEQSIKFIDKSSQYKQEIPKLNLIVKLKRKINKQIKSFKRLIQEIIDYYKYDNLKFQQIMTLCDYILSDRIDMNSNTQIKEVKSVTTVRKKTKTHVKKQTAKIDSYEKLW